jgi:ATP-dependent DNA helicase DinG
VTRPSSRFEPAAAETLRQAIRAAGGVEVFAIGDVADGVVTSVVITCRGTDDSVPALVDRPNAGQAVIHNHPSGNLYPSGADLALAGLYGEDGVGVVIVDSDVTRSNWVVEPFVKARRPVSDEALLRFFHDDLPKVLPGFEPRGQQIEMAQRVAAALDEGKALLCEAGTGTGKSLAYLAPAALWALTNESKVVVSTHTRALQAQLLSSDLPLLNAAGLPVRTAVLQGRNNYLCRRRLDLAVDEAEAGGDEAEKQALRELVAWSATTTDGSRSDLSQALEPSLWDRVLSDSDLSLSVKCPLYDRCHYYRARREAAAAHVVVVNHALLLVDLALRHQLGRGVLPKYDRVILDEAHHLEDAATGAATEDLSARAVQRALRPLVDTRRRRGALTRLVQGPATKLATGPREQLEARAAGLMPLVHSLGTGVEATLAPLARQVHQQSVRITEPFRDSEAWSLDVVPVVRHLQSELDDVVRLLEQLAEPFTDLRLDDVDQQALLDLNRARRRLTRHAEVATAFLDDDADRCRWLAPDRGRRRLPLAKLAVAPIEVADTLKKILFHPIPGVTCTSATLTVRQRFGFFRARAGVTEADEVLFPSPFDHASQAILGLPRDLPDPNHDDYLPATARVIQEAVRASDGGAFVLCTSYRAVEAYRRQLEGHGRTILAQGHGSRSKLLERFKEQPRSVLVGTDSFWEGVSVKGWGLRLVIIPRVPFRVPTEPLQQARHERLQQRGIDPFRAYVLPEAVIKLRQGYGRLIRGHDDRGAVLLLDRRIHDRAYGRILLQSLPPARRVVGPWRRVLEELQRLYGPAGGRR